MLTAIKEMIKSVGIDTVVAIFSAIIGWVFAFYQMRRNRIWQKKDTLANRRYEAYQNFMKKLDDISESIRNNPNMIYGISKELMSIFLKNDVEDFDDAILRFNEKLTELVKDSTESLMIINQEIYPLLLIASDELNKKLIQLKHLITDYNNEVQNCLSSINAKDGDSFKVLETMGHNERQEEYQSLTDEIIKLMRKEINV